MAMRFYQAGMPHIPDYAAAEMQQAEIANQLRAQEKQGYLSGAAQLAPMVPEGAWADLGASMGLPGVEAAGAAGSKAAMEAGIQQGLAQEMAALQAIEAGASGAELGSAAAALEGATAGATAGAGAGAAPGFMSALGAMGPMGWAALAALGMGLMR
jgi:hypothetical protein